MNRKQRNIKKLSARKKLLDVLIEAANKGKARLIGLHNEFHSRSHYTELVRYAMLQVSNEVDDMPEENIRQLFEAITFANNRAMQSKYGSLGYSRKSSKIYRACANSRNLESERCESIGKSIEFDGCDIIITDPCYIMPERVFDPITHELSRKDVGGTRRRHEIHSLESDTLYGDWSCSVFKIVRTSKRRMKKHAVNIGSFCADGGMVMVAKLSDVLEFNPEFDYHLTKPWTTALIKNFKGKVTFKYVKKLDELQLVGEGSVNFVTTQTGF